MSRVMKRQYTYPQGYNAQAVVGEDHIVLAARIPGVGRPAPAAPHASRCAGQPHLRRILERIGVALADSGYYSEANLEAAERDDSELLIAVRNERNQTPLRSLGQRRVHGRGRTGHADKLATERGANALRQRAHTVEPVFGHIKEVRKVRRFARRGLGACDLEWKLQNPDSRPQERCADRRDWQAP